MSPETCSHQRLVCITPGCVGYHQLPVLERPFSQPFGALVEQDVAGSAWVLLAIFDFRDFRLAQVGEIKALLRLDARVTIDRGVTDIAEDFTGAVLFNR